MGKNLDWFYKRVFLFFNLDVNLLKLLLSDKPLNFMLSFTLLFHMVSAVALDLFDCTNHAVWVCCVDYLCWYFSRHITPPYNCQWFCVYISFIICIIKIINFGPIVISLWLNLYEHFLIANLKTKGLCRWELSIM